MLTLDIISPNPQLNSYVVSKVANFAAGETVKVIMRLWQPDLKIRYIPSNAAVITVDLKKSDNTTLTKTCSFTFVDDRSIIEFNLTASESEQVISQNLVVKIVDGSDTKIALLQYGLRRVKASGAC
jgi:hypothetical protein